jgi:hypothetical protein
MSKELPEGQTHSYDLQHCKVCNQMTNHLNGVCQKHLPQPACLCAGLRRRNAGLCLKCEIERWPTEFPQFESDAFDAGYRRAKQDFLRLLEQ